MRPTLARAGVRTGSPRASPRVAAAVVLLAVFAPLALSAPPPEPWSPATVGDPGDTEALPPRPAAPGGRPTGLAFDDAGENIVVGSGDIGVPDPNDPVDRDLFFYGFASGFIASETDTDATREGKTAVAISGDGTRVLAGAGYTGVSNLFAYAWDDPDAVIASRQVPGPVTTLALSRDGRLAAVGTGNATAGRVHFLDDVLDQRWDAEFPGRVNRVAISDEGGYLAAGGAKPSGVVTIGEVVLLQTSPRQELLRREVKEVGGEVTDIAMSGDGRFVVAGTAAGGLIALERGSGVAVAFEGKPAAMASLPVTRISKVAVSDDGAVLAAGDQARVYVLERRGTGYALAWAAEAGGAVAHLAMTPEGAYVAASATALVSYHRSSPEALFTLNLTQPFVALARPDPGRDEVRLVAVTATEVHAFRLRADHTISPPAGSPSAPPGKETALEFTVTNTGDTAASLLINVHGGFELRPRIDTPLVAVLPGRTANATIVIRPDPDTPSESFRLNVSATNIEAELSRSAFVDVAVAPAPSLELNLSATEAGILQGQESQFVVAAHNRGNTPFNINFGVSQDPSDGVNWQVELNPSIASASPGASTLSILTVKAPSNALNGTENVVTVRAQTDGLTPTAELLLVVNPHFGVSLTVNPLSRTAFEGRAANYTLLVTNNGSLTSSFRLHTCVVGPVTSGAAVRPGHNVPCFGNATEDLHGWSVSIDQNPFTLGRGQTREFLLVVDPPSGAAPGEKLSLQVDVVSARTEEGARAFVVATTNVIEPPPFEDPFKEREREQPGFELLLAAAAVGIVAARMRRARR